MDVAENSNASVAILLIAKTSKAMVTSLTAVRNAPSQTQSAQAQG